VKLKLITGLVTQPLTVVEAVLMQEGDATLTDAHVSSQKYCFQV